MAYRQSHVPVETPQTGGGGARISQTPIELAEQGNGAAHFSQIPVETLRTGGNAYFSHLALEMLVPAPVTAGSGLEMIIIS